jgi:tripartite-type tricarboxylate transporter receptor subunit TctC
VWSHWESKERLAAQARRALEERFIPALQCDEERCRKEKNERWAKFKEAVGKGESVGFSIIKEKVQECWAGVEDVSNVAQLKAGSLRALAVTTPRRLPALPNIPTFAELGYPNLTGSQWLGLSAPKGLPAPIAQRLTALIPEILARPDLAARFEELQTLPRTPNVYGEDFNKLIRSQIDSWRTVARNANVEVIS